jgi:flagellar assembly factor FliW
MKFTNRQFGELDFEEAHVLDFPDGIIGFEGSRKYLIVDDVDSEPFRWLVSLEDPDLSFALVGPDIVGSEYEAKLLKGSDETVFLLAALRNPVEASTINLRSPVVIENSRQTGHQIIVEDESLSMQYPLFARRSKSGE